MCILVRLDPGVYLLLSVHCPKCQRLKSNQAAWKQLMELRRQYPVYVVWLEAATGLVAKLVRAAYRAVRPSPRPRARRAGGEGGDAAGAHSP